MFTTLPRKRFSDEIVEQMIGLIKDGRLKPGDSLPSEREIAQKLGCQPTSPAGSPEDAGMSRFH